MSYYLDLFSPETYEAFSNSSRNVSGFRLKQKKSAAKINLGDKLICYMTKLSRWFGVLEVTSNYFEDTSPLFYSENDPFMVRFNVKPLVWLDKEKAIPIRENELWDNLSFTKGYNKASSHWTGKLRSSLGHIDDSDGKLIENLLYAQMENGKVYKIDEHEYEKLNTHKIRTLDKVISVSVPDNNDIEAEEVLPNQADVRESIKMQALLTDIGTKMGMKIWIPKNDRVAVSSEMKGDKSNLLNTLPLNYDETTIKTIEQIDVLWLKGRAIARAFEVEHTTSIYSGLLRMADLLALQPNMDIKLHIVAPTSRRDKVFQELRRPVFSLLEKGPLYESCTYISYDSLKELAKQKHLAHLSDSVLEEYSEDAEL